MNRKFSNEIINKVRDAKRRGATYRAIAEKYNMTVQHAFFICKNRARIDARLKPIKRRPLNVKFCVEQYRAGKSFSQIAFLEASHEKRSKPYHRDTIKKAVENVLEGLCTI